MKTLLLLGTLLTSQMIYAHGDHPKRIAPCEAKECTSTQIETAVPLAIEGLVKAGQLTSDWTSAKLEKTEKKKFKKGSEWVAVVNNPKQKDASKQKLYIFITLDGYLNGANYTGE